MGPPADSYKADGDATLWSQISQSCVLFTETCIPLSLFLSLSLRPGGSVHLVPLTRSLTRYRFSLSPSFDVFPLRKFLMGTSTARYCRTLQNAFNSIHEVVRFEL
jgi:hypothetical protein